MQGMRYGQTFPGNMPFSLSASGIDTISRRVEQENCLLSGAIHFKSIEISDCTIIRFPIAPVTSTNCNIDSYRIIDTEISLCAKGRINGSDNGREVRISRTILSFKTSLAYAGEIDIPRVIDHVHRDVDRRCIGITVDSKGIDSCDNCHYYQNDSDYTITITFLRWSLPATYAS